MKTLEKGFAMPLTRDQIMAMIDERIGWYKAQNNECDRILEAGDMGSADHAELTTGNGACIVGLCFLKNSIEAAEGKFG